jgi:hypothetical protein
MGGDEDNVSGCIKHLVSLAEDFMDDADDWMEEYIRNPVKQVSSMKLRFGRKQFEQFFYSCIMGYFLIPKL